MKHRKILRQEKIILSSDCQCTIEQKIIATILVVKSPIVAMRAVESTHANFAMNPYFLSHRSPLTVCMFVTKNVIFQLRTTALNGFSKR